MVSNEAPNPSRVLAWLQLMRLPNVFTAMADIFMGYWFTHETLSPVSVFLLLLASSSCLYTAGMVLNDLFDLEQDRRERPQRPLPSKRVPFFGALRLAFLLIVSGEIFAVAAAWLAHDPRPIIIAPVLTILIVKYNSKFKRTRLSPLVMGSCRFLNVLLGMSTPSAALTAANYLVAGGIGVYIAGITWFAHREAAQSERRQLIGAFSVILAGIALLVVFPIFLPQGSPDMAVWTVPWIVLWGMVIALIGRRFVYAIADPEPSQVQCAVKAAILSIIILDALVAFALRGPWALASILLLLVPAIALGRWVYST